MSKPTAQSKAFLIVSVAMRWAVGITFLISSTHKLTDPHQFLFVTYGYEIGGPTLGLIAAIVVPYLELLTACALLVNCLPEGAFLNAIVLSSIFLAAQISVVYRGIDTSCGCFSSSASDLVGYASILRVTLLLALSLVGFYFCRPRQNAPGYCVEEFKEGHISVS